MKKKDMLAVMRVENGWIVVFISHGTKMAVADAPVSFTASETFLKTGRSRCVEPAFLGFVPPTTLVPEDLNVSDASFYIGARDIFESPKPYRTRWLAGRGNYNFSLRSAPR